MFKLAKLLSFFKSDSTSIILTTLHASMREIPHPHGLGFLLHSQNQCSDSTGLTSRVSLGTVLQIQKPVTINSLTNKMKNVKPYIPVAKARGFMAKEGKNV